MCLSRIDSFSGYFKKITADKQVFENQRRALADTYEARTYVAAPTPPGEFTLRSRLPIIKDSGTKMPFRGGLLKSGGKQWIKYSSVNGAKSRLIQGKMLKNTQ